MVDTLVPHHFFRKDNPERFISRDYLCRYIVVLNPIESRYIFDFARKRIALVLFEFTLSALYSVYLLSSARVVYALVARLTGDV